MGKERCRDLEGVFLFAFRESNSWTMKKQDYVYTIKNI